MKDAEAEMKKLSYSRKALLNTTSPVLHETTACIGYLPKAENN